MGVLHIVCEQRPVEMFSRATIIVPQCQQVRGMATLKAIQIRLKSVKNIQKITQSMKMVSAAKYARAERELKVCRPYGVDAQQFFEKAEVKDEEGEKGQLIIAVSSDRGLCGAVHSSIGRICKAAIAENPNTKVVIIGDKVRNILQRNHAGHIAMVVTEIGPNLACTAMPPPLPRASSTPIWTLTRANLCSTRSKRSSRTAPRPCPCTARTPSTTRPRCPFTIRWTAR